MSDTANSIVVENVVKTYKGGKVKALNGLSLSARAGEALGIIGPNGAGKTTLFGCLLGFLKMDSGSISISGMPSDYLAVRRLVGYLPERLDFDKWMTGHEFVSLHHALTGFDTAVRKTEVENLLTLVDLEQSAWHRPLSKYSRGMLQRLGLAQALIGKPRVLLLDEPASGVDPGGVLLFRSILRKFKQQGTTILLNSHQLDQVERICDRVVFIKGGKAEAVEDLHDTTISEGIALIKVIPGEDSQTKEHYQQVLKGQSVAPLIEAGDDSARFVVQGQQQIAALIKYLVEQQISITHASLEDQGLERFFIASSKTVSELPAGNESEKPTETAGNS